MLIEFLVEESRVLVTKSCIFILIFEQAWKVMKEFLVGVMKQASDQIGLSLIGWNVIYVIRDLRTLSRY